MLDLYVMGEASILVMTLHVSLELAVLVFVARRILLDVVWRMTMTFWVTDSCTEVQYEVPVSPA